jgi:hypothetical protein
MADSPPSKRPSSRTPRSSKPKADTGPGDTEFQSAPRTGSAFIAGTTFSAKPVRYSDIDGVAMFEGDIVLGTVEEVEAASQVIAAGLRGEVQSAVIITGSQFRWANCTVPYDIDATLPNQARVTDAIAHWESHTPFRFVLRTSANAGSYPDWVTFRPSTGCSSSVGKRGGQQFVNLASGCSTGNAIHEIGHTVGLWHEQSREDRDAFVTIHWDKIQAGMEHNFDQHISDGDDVGAYDYGSIMHYPRDAFSVDGSDTITPVDATATIGQRTALSPGDIAAASTLCPGTIVETLKEHSPETLKELSPETVKEHFPETIKEHNPETIKEQNPETLKELSPETIKERIPETIKERIPETIKERIPETIWEGGGGTLVENGPGSLAEGTFPGGNLQPQVPGGGGVLPFAMMTPTAGVPGQASLAGMAGQPADVDTAEALLAQLAQVNQQLDALLGQVALLQSDQQQLVAALGNLGFS